VKKLIIAAVAVIVLAAGGIYWFVIRDTPAKELGLPVESNDGSSSDGTTPASIDGTWKVQSSDPTKAGLRIKESFLSGIADHTAVGRTSQVTGTLTLEGSKATAGSFTVDLTSLEFTDDPPGLDVANRARAMENAGLETNKFPDTTFKLTEPIDLGEVPKDGTEITKDVTGELTLHGVTKPVTFSVDAQLSGDHIDIATTDPVPVKLTDYDITPPVQGPVAKVSDTGSFEFVVRLDRS
jgi:polyisoprenoid-binding protein YceI